MIRLCGCPRHGGGPPCRRIAAPGKLRCIFHGGARGHGRHLSEDRHHSQSLAKAHAKKWSVPHDYNSSPGGLVRAATAVRLPNGRFAPNNRPRQKRDRLVAKALARVIAMQRARAVAKEATLRVVPDDPGVDDAVLEPRAGPLEGSTATARPEAAESEGSAVAAAESLGEAEEVLEELVIALLEARNPLNEADKTDSLWTLVASELSDGLWDRLDGWIDKHTTGTE